MNFPSIDIQGAILSADLLAKIRSEQASFQQGKDFQPDLSNAKLKDEISLVWREVRDQWNIFKSKKARLKEGDSGTTETRNFWIVPLLTNLGYNLSFSKSAEEINGKSFLIGFRDPNLDGFPVYIGSYNESLDRRPDNKQLRVSPHAMVQEYLNYSEHLYGIVTNGHQLRLLRDASRITRLSYVEFNLEKMMEEDLYADFVILYRLLHASRMPKRMDAGGDSIIEKYHLESLEAGSTIRNKLGSAVKGAILSLANGFMNHPDNAELRAAAASAQFDADAYYRHQLRIIYRLLFLFVIEERNLVYGNNKNPETKRFHQIYTQHFSLMRLRKKAKRLLPPEAARHNDLWQGLISTFSLFEKKAVGEKLGIMALQGDLFGYPAIVGQGYDLHYCQLSNADLLNIIQSLGYFENEQGVLIAVNYGGLDVEEFGSVYEGLLELKLQINPVPGADQYRCSFDTSNERSKSGSHYTPEELVQPLIKHSLDYLIADKLKDPDPEQALLSLKVADVACGSGHILLSAARRIAHELACLQETSESNSREKVEQPAPTYVRKAMKEVVRHCIYGVDKNPLAVELCKIALWLEAYNPGEPLNFLDHHIKCGDAIVGLAHRSELQKGIADEAFKTLPGDDKEVAKTWRDRNVKERKSREAKSLQLQTNYERSADDSLQAAIADYKAFTQMPESTPEQIEQKAKIYRKFVEGKGYTFLKAMADTQVAQFFIPKTEANKGYLLTDADYRQMLAGYKGWQLPQTAKAKVVAQEKGFFHWFLEFPEVFQQGGFDCVLGNPPYLGGNKVTINYGFHFSNVLHYVFDINGAADLIVYFLHRIFSVIRTERCMALITAQSIKEGISREEGLFKLIQKDLCLNFAISDLKWPGKANTDINIISGFKKLDLPQKSCNGEKVRNINSYLKNEQNEIEPVTLYFNSKNSFQGIAVGGDGFILSKEESELYVELNEEFKKVIWPYFIGEDLNNSPNLSASRCIINFSTYNLEQIKEFDALFKRIFEHVFPERQKNNREARRKFWFHFAEKATGMYAKISNLKTFYIAAKTSKHLSFVKETDVNKAFDQSLTVISLDNSLYFTILQSDIHLHWARKYSTSQGGTPRYNPSDAFQNFPFPYKLTVGLENQLQKIGELYNHDRSQLMLGVQLGLTKLYNLYHSNAITKVFLNEKDKQVIALQKHLEKTEGTISFVEAIAGIIKLRALHVEMDQAVLEAYGWGDVALRHDFYEVDYLPENDRIRYTIHPGARKEILKRLLALNHQIHAEEVAAGLWEKKKAPGKTKTKAKSEKEESGYGDLFEKT